MSLTNLIADLDSHLKNEEKELESLRNLLLSKRISQSSFDLVEKKISLEISLATSLKEALKAEEGYWQNSISDASQILELLLIQFRHRFLLGEIGEEELTQKDNIISQGLAALTGKEVSKDSVVSEVSKDTLLQEPAQPLQITLEQPNIQTFQESVAKLGIEEPSVSSIVDQEEKVIEPAQTKRISNGGQSANRRRKQLSKEPPELDGSIDSAAHCMNPWKPECRNTDIELSIYYKGRPTPICHKCWEDISNKNVEWSSL